ncbi:MAG: hypothetical protein WA839_07640 [Flavobacteriaceae bacterium]|tara:strand:+ start:6197 stop:6364 length:168 start_codon:yes stop_codon:yes gene_type:complete
MEKEKENFEFVKESEDDKGNYIFQKDKITKKTTTFVVVVLVILLIGVIVSSFFFK